MYTTPGLELLLHLKLESLERAVREQHATHPARRTSTPWRTRMATTLAAVRRTAQPAATVERRAHPSTVPCCA